MVNKLTVKYLCVHHQINTTVGSDGQERFAVLVLEYLSYS